MAYLEAKMRNGRAYYYFTRNRRAGGRWKKTRTYIGTAPPAHKTKIAGTLDSAYRAALPKIRALAKHPKVAACYLFGSYAKSPSTANDIDVCILGKGLDTDEMANMSQQFSSPVDISFLSRMPHYVAINVLRGRALFISNRGQFERIWRETVREYLESQPMRERIYAGVERWMNSQTAQTG